MRQLIFNCAGTSGAYPGCSKPACPGCSLQRMFGPVVPSSLEGMFLPRYLAPTFAVRETDVSRHQGGPIGGPPKTPRTSVL